MTSWLPARPWSCPAGELLLSAGAPRPIWLDARRAGIGASDAGAIFGFDKYRTPWQVWAEKTGEEAPEQDGRPQRRGRFYELPTIQAWVEERREDGVPCQFRRHGLTRSKVHQEIMATVDALEVCPHGRGLIEVKTSGSITAWNEWADDEVPVKHQFQVAQQLYVTGRDHVHVLFMDRWGSIEHRLLLRDEEMEQTIAEMVAYLVEWWQRHIIDGVEPAVQAQDLSVMSRRWRPDPKKTVRLDGQLVEDARRLRQMERDLCEMKASVDAARAELRKQVGDAVCVEDQDGRLLATWNVTKRICGGTDSFVKKNRAQAEPFIHIEPAEVVDWAAFIEAHPDGPVHYERKWFWRD